MKKILIADDSLFMRNVLKNILSKETFTSGKGGSASGGKASTDKYVIVEADSGSKTMEQFKKEKPDLVLLDIIMPESEGEGVGTLKKIMKIDSKAKVVMISAVGQDAIIEECKKHGAKDYIVKPFSEKLVAETAEKYLSG